MTRDLAAAALAGDALARDVWNDSVHALAAHLAGRGIQTVVNYPVALPFLPAYARLGHGVNDFPAAHGHQSRILSLPIFPEMTTAQMESVCNAVREFAA